MKAFGVDLPDWFIEEALTMDGAVNLNSVLGILLKDYLRRHAPGCPHSFQKVTVWDSKETSEFKTIQPEICALCGVWK